MFLIPLCPNFEGTSVSPQSPFFPIYTFYLVELIFSGLPKSMNDSTFEYNKPKVTWAFLLFQKMPSNRDVSSSGSALIFCSEILVLGQGCPTNGRMQLQEPLLILYWISLIPENPGPVGWRASSFWMIHSLWAQTLTLLLCTYLKSTSVSVTFSLLGAPKGFLTQANKT